MLSPADRNATGPVASARSFSTVPANFTVFDEVTPAVVTDSMRPW